MNDKYEKITFVVIFLAILISTGAIVYYRTQNQDSVSGLYMDEDRCEITVPEVENSGLRLVTRRWFSGTCAA